MPKDIKVHLHTFRRMKKDPETYFCMGAKCYFKMEKELLNGKQAQCPTCGRAMILGYEELRRALPKCPICRGDKNATNIQKAMSALAIQEKLEEKNENLI